MKKISKKREAEIESILAEDNDEDKWDRKELGNDSAHVIKAPEFAKTTSIGTSVQLPLKLIKS